MSLVLDGVTRLRDCGASYRVVATCLDTRIGLTLMTEVEMVVVRCSMHTVVQDASFELEGHTCYVETNLISSAELRSFQGYVIETHTHD